MVQISGKWSGTPSVPATARQMAACAAGRSIFGSPSISRIPKPSLRASSRVLVASTSQSVNSPDSMPRRMAVPIQVCSWS